MREGSLPSPQEIFWCLLLESRTQRGADLSAGKQWSHFAICRENRNPIWWELAFFFSTFNTSKEGLRNLWTWRDTATHTKHLRNRQEASLQSIKCTSTAVFEVNGIHKNEEQVTRSGQSLLHRAEFTEEQHFLPWCPADIDKAGNRLRCLLMITLKKNHT